MNKYRRYVYSLVLGYCGLSAAVVAINYFVDPYLIFDRPRKAGVNLIKPEINEHVYLMKKYHPTHHQWDVLLVGNSRIEMGLDPTHQCFRQLKSRVYNLGIPGASVERQTELALNLVYAQKIQHVFISVDLQDFLVRADRLSPNTDTDLGQQDHDLRFLKDGSENRTYWRHMIADRYRALYSLAALADSLQSVMSQSAVAPNRDAHGFNPARDFAHATDIEGPNAIFAQKMASLEKRFAENWSLFYRDGTVTEGFVALENFLKIAASRGIDVTVFTGPYHEMYWTLLQRSDLHELHEVWLDEIIDIVHRQDIDIELWDFSIDSEYIHEGLPENMEIGSPLRWFWEPAHYRRELGDLMLNAMLVANCETKVSFGRKLSD